MPPAFVLSQDQTLRLKTDHAGRLTPAQQQPAQRDPSSKTVPKPKLEPCDSCVVFEDVLTDGPNFVPQTALNRAAACASLLSIRSTCQRSVKPEAAREPRFSRFPTVLLVSRGASARREAVYRAAPRTLSRAFFSPCRFFTRAPLGPAYGPGAPPHQAAGGRHRTGADGA